MNHNTNNLLKFNLYVLSLALLFIFVIIITVQFPDSCFKADCLYAWLSLAKSNIATLASIFSLLYCLFSYKHLGFKLRGAPDTSFKINKIESINYEHLTFLATYVVPLISFDFSSGRQMLVLLLLLVVMGIMYIKTDLFYANPSLALLGFHIYRVDAKFKTGAKEGIVIISHGRISEGEEVSHIKLDDRIFYVKSKSK
jgi:hypothetical protein